MNFALKRVASAALIPAAVLIAPTMCRADEWPTKPITLVVPQGTGSGSDVIARLLSAYMQPALGQTVIVDNRSGAGGIIAHQSVMRAAPDGYTILLTSTAQLLVVPMINSAAKYNLDDFVPVAPVLRAPFAILVANTPASPKTLAELLSIMRSKQSAYASAGVGTMTHLGSEVFLQRAGVKATHVPYKGSSAALTDLIGGQVLFATDSLTAAVPFIKSGKLRALAVTGDARESTLPEVPTLAESGLRGEPIAVIGGIFAPKGIKPEIVAKIRAAVDKALANPELGERFASIETGILNTSTSNFLEQLHKQAPIWSRLVEQLNLKVQ